MRKVLFDQIQKRGSVKRAVAAGLPPNGRSVGAVAFLLLAVLATLFAADTHAQANTRATGEPTISGAPQVGEILTVDANAIDDADGVGAFSYQWIRVDGGTDTDITEATSSSYTLTSDDVGKKIRVRVSFTDGEGNAEQVTSDAWPSSGSIIAVSTAVVLSLSANSVDEGTGPTAITVTGTLNGVARPSDTEVTVAVGDSADSASEGTDYATVADLTLTIDAGETTGTASFTLTTTDDDVDEGDETLSVMGTTTASDLSVTGTTATIVDDDERGVTVSTPTLTVPEGGTTIYTVVLQSQPTATVTVTPSVSGDADVTVSPSSLSFSTGDWKTAQTVTVSAAQDADADDDAAMVSHGVSGGDYASETASDVSVTVSDDDPVLNPPAAPTRPVVTEATHSRVTISWDDPGDASITGYQILRRDRDLHPHGHFEIIEEDTASADTAYDDTSVEPLTRYVYRVKARNAAGLSDWSEWRRANVPAAPAPDPIPVDDRADDVSLGDITDLSGAASLTGTVESGGDTEDFFGFSLTESKDVAVALSGLDVDANLFIEDDSGNVIHESVHQGVEDDSISATLASGSYFFRVVAVAYGTNDYELSYALSEASTTVEVTDDYSADSDTAASITLDADGAGSATGSIETAGDIDWFAVDLNDGQEYWIEVLAGPSGSGTLAAPILAGVYDADGTAVSTGSLGGEGVEPRIAFTPTATATYFIAAAAYRNEGGFYEFGATGTYKVTVAHADNSADDFSAFTDTTGELIAGGAAVRAELEVVGDYDWFKFEAEAGRRYGVSIAGFSQGKGTLKYGHAYGVFDSEGDLVDGAKFGYSSVHHFDPSESGTYYVGVRAIPGWVDADDVTGTYRVKLSERTLVWSSPMTLGVIDSTAPTGMGYTTWTHPRSALGVRNFELDGDQYGILAVMHFADGLYLSTSRPLANKFNLDWTRTITLHGGEEVLVGYGDFAATVSKVPAMRGDGRYWWPTGLVGWDVGHELEVSITTSVAPQPLPDRPLARPTAHFSSIPKSHDGSEIFTVELIFPEAMDLKAESLRDHSLDIANGSIASVIQRQNSTLSIWVISVRPDSTDDVTVSLNSGGACDKTGAVCIPDGRRLRNNPAVTVPGPANPPSG